MAEQKHGLWIPYTVIGTLLTVVVAGASIAFSLGTAKGELIANREQITEIKNQVSDNTETINVIRESLARMTAILDRLEKKLP